jgi:HEAT repeat protein
MQDLVGRLIDELKDEDFVVRKIAAWSLGDLGPEASPAVPALIEALKDSDRFVRRAAAWTLGRIGPAAAPAVPALTEALHDQDRAARFKVAEALGRIGDPAAVPALTKAFEEETDCDVRRFVLRSLLVVMVK